MRHAKRVEQISENVLYLNQGTLYPALLRLQQWDWIISKWGVSENNRRTHYYSLTKAGYKQLQVETENWEHIATIIQRILEGAS